MQGTGNISVHTLEIYQVLGGITDEWRSVSNWLTDADFYFGWKVFVVTLDDVGKRFTRPSETERQQDEEDHLLQQPRYIHGHSSSAPDYEDNNSNDDDDDDNNNIDNDNENDNDNDNEIIIMVLVIIIDMIMSINMLLIAIYYLYPYNNIITVGPIIILQQKTKDAYCSLHTLVFFCVDEGSRQITFDVKYLLTQKQFFDRFVIRDTMPRDVAAASATRAELNQR